MALSLSAFRVNITLLTDGGQRVTLYTVSVCVCICVRVMYIEHSIYMAVGYSACARVYGGACAVVRTMSLCELARA